MTTTETPDALLKLAREIVERHGGDFERTGPSVIAAIRETSRLAAEYADKVNGVGSPRLSFVGDRLRNFAHLKETHNHDQ